MAFINEYISEEDIKKYGIREIWDQFHPFSKNDMNLLKKHSWTVDKERDVFFIPAKSGREEKSSQVIAILWWKGAYLSVTLANVGGHYDHVNKKGDKRWQLIDVWRPAGFEVSDEDIIPVLKEALVKYGFSGIAIPVENYTVNFAF